MKKTIKKSTIITAAVSFTYIAALAMSFMSIAEAATNVTITQSNMQGWAFVNDQGTSTPATGVLATGPATPPFVEGSAQFGTSAVNEGQIIVKAGFLGNQISDFTTLTYATFQNATNASAATALSLQFNIDKDVTDGDLTYQGRMVYEPYLNNGGTVPLNTWTTWDAKAGKWWFSRTNPGQTFALSNCTPATPCTLSQIEALYPNIGVHATFGAVLFKAGSGWTGSFNGAVDNLTVGIAGLDTIYDFDIDDVTAPIAPSPVSPANNSVLTTANLIKIDWTDVTDRSSPVTYIYEAAYSNAVDVNGAFVSPIYTSSVLTASEIPTPGAAEAVYFWHVQATDNKGNKSPWSVTQKVTVDNTAPNLATLANVGPIEATSPSGAVVTYTNPVATDTVDISVATTCVIPSGSTFPLGITGVICNASDTAGNAATSTTFNVTVVDTTAPVIAVTGSSTVSVQAGVPFVDLGAIANDVSGNFVASSTHNVNVNVLGSYSVIYTATDASGNSAASTTRTVNVVDTSAPAIPVVTSPLANAKVRTVDLAKLDWADVVDFSSPVSYAYQLATSNVTNSVGGAFSFPTLTANLLSISEGDLASSSISTEGEYYFIARATDALGNSGLWSTPSKFTIDNTAPVLTLGGTDPLTIEGGSLYTDAGATGTDNLDASVAVITTGTVNTSALGSTTLSYSATDTAGNIAIPVTRTVNVVDTTAPVIAVTGANPMTLEAGTAYVELGATVSDNISTPITATATGTVSILVPGSYTITYTATDASGNSATSTTRTVDVVDTTAPAMNIIGQNPNIVTINNVYVDSGATSMDIVDGIITVTSSSTVDTAVLGNYVVVYTATDTRGNSASSSRTVIVVPPDTTAPVITILGSNPLTIEGGSSYTDAGATALDNVNGNLTSSIATVNGVNANVVGGYTVTYNISDGAGNAATPGVRTVNVVDTTAPVITLTGASIVTLHTGDTYTELGATAVDIVDPAVSVIVGGDTVTTTATSTFIVTYKATDASGNAATQVTRTVHVVDIAVPIITVTGSSTITLEYGTSYTDAGATAIDDVDGDISANVITTGTVNTSVLGSYTLTYTVTDSSSNSAMSAVRTVNVVDTTAPVITLNGSSTISLMIGDTYVELNASSTDAVDGIITASITGSVDTNTAGIYNLLYTATDLSGNSATTSRTVTITALPVVPVVVTNTGGSTGGGSTSGGGGFVPFLTTNATTTPVSTLATSTQATASTGRVLGISTFKFDKNLRLGMKNNDVIELQKVLASLGFFKTAPTGYFGQISLKAAKAFQKSKGISQTGFVGVLTRAELNK